MMHEGPDGEHVTYRPDERTRPGRPWRNTAPLCAPPEVRQPYGPGCGHPQALTPPLEGPAAGGLEKGGRESSRSSQLPLSVKPWQVTANAFPARYCQNLPSTVRPESSQHGTAGIVPARYGQNLPRRIPASSSPADPCQRLENVPPPASTTSGAATDAAQYRHQRPNLTAGMCISARHPA